MARFRLWNLDVWGNEADGFTVNDRSEVGSVELVDTADDTIVDTLIADGWLKSNAIGRVKVDDIGGDGEVFYILDASNDQPIFQLRRQSPIRRPNCATCKGEKAKKS